MLTATIFILWKKYEDDIGWTEVKDEFYSKEEAIRYRDEVLHKIYINHPDWIEPRYGIQTVTTTFQEL